MWSVAFSPDGTLAVSSSGCPDGDKTVRLWDVQMGREVQRFEGHAHPSLDACFLANGKQVLSGADDGTLRLWETETGEEQLSMKMPGRGQCGAASTDGRLAAAGSSDGNCYLFDLTTGDEIQRFSGHEDRVLDVDLSPDGQHFIAARA